MIDLKYANPLVIALDTANKSVIVLNKLSNLLVIMLDVMDWDNNLIKVDILDVVWDMVKYEVIEFIDEYILDIDWEIAKGWDRIENRDWIVEVDWNSVK